MTTEGSNKGGKMSGTVLDRLVPQLGFNPTDINEMLAAASHEVARLRKVEAEKEVLLAAYRARFDGHSSSHYEHERSSYLSTIIQKLKGDKEKNGDKYSETGLEKEARASSEYIAWLDRAQVDRQYMYKLDAELAQVRADIEGARMNRENILVGARMNEELVRFMRAEMGLS